MVGKTTLNLNSFSAVQIVVSWVFIYNIFRGRVGKDAVGFIPVVCRSSIAMQTTQHLLASQEKSKSIYLTALELG